MKTMITLIISVLFSLGCKEEDNVVEQETSIYGTWQLRSRWLGNVGDTEVKWTDVSDGYTMELSEENKYSSTEFSVCRNVMNNGNFTLSEIVPDTFIVISFPCDSTNDELERKYLYSFEGNDLILTPYSHPCDEGCAYRFEKITD